MPAGAVPLLGPLLRDVSRSFYLTLRWLPGSVGPQIGLGYLLARATDTVADTEIVPLPERLAALGALRDRVLGTRLEPLNLGALARHQGTPAERVLLERFEEAVAILNTLAEADRAAIRTVVATITSGQELDLKRFGTATPPAVIPLATAAELDDYTYRVAGCVGEFWTRVCRAHVFPRAKLDETVLHERAVRFGQGLQLVNILRDLPGDLRQGRCYLPATELSAAGLAPADLLQPANEARLRPVYDRWLDRAQAHLQAGWEYTNSLPWNCPRIRLPCAWPILIGAATLARLRTGPVLDPAVKLKVTRGEVRQILQRSLLRYPFPASWRKMFPFRDGNPIAPRDGFH